MDSREALPAWNSTISVYCSLFVTQTIAQQTFHAGIVSSPTSFAKLFSFRIFVEEFRFMIYRMETFYESNLNILESNEQTATEFSLLKKN